MRSTVPVGDRREGVVVGPLRACLMPTCQDRCEGSQIKVVLDLAPPLGTRAWPRDRISKPCMASRFVQINLSQSELTSYSTKH